jgi:hypothetical protein
MRIARAVSEICHSLVSKFTFVPRGYKFESRSFTILVKNRKLFWIGYGNLPRETAFREVGRCDPTTGNPAVDFSVSTTIGTGPRRSENRPSVEPDFDLSLATAQDAAAALGGVLMPPHETSQRTASLIHLSQPQIAAD